MEFLLTFLRDCGPGKKEVRAGDAVNFEKLDTCRCNHRIPKKVGFSKLDRQSGTEELSYGGSCAIYCTS